MTSRRRQLGLVLSLPALAVPALVVPTVVPVLTATPAAAATKPPPTKTLPTALDVSVPYQAQTVCDPRPRPGVVAFATLMTSHYGMGSVSLIGRPCGSGPSEHYDGRAWDWMLNVSNPSQEAVAQSVLAWLTAPDANGVQGAMARRFGIMYIIHNRKMWRAYATDRGWAPYYGSSPHTDHVHFSFTYNGAAGVTSWWTGRAATTVRTTLPPAGTTLPTTQTPAPPPPPPATPVPAGVLSFGMTSAAVKTLQTRLGSLPTTGYFGTLTKARVIAYQTFAGLPRTGVADLRTQQILAERGWRTVAAAYPTLRFGTTSAAVKTLQTRLGGLPTTGYYGTLTQARVTAYQRAVKLPVTGVADPSTQYALVSRGWPAAATVSLTTTARASTPVVLPAVLTQEETVMTTFATAPSISSAPSISTAVAPTRAVRTNVGVARVEVDTAYTRVKDLLLGPGTRGAPVRVLQRGLGGLAVDGVYGSVTAAKVAALQRSLGVAATGVVTPEVWDALEARDYPFATSRSTVLRAGDSGPQVSAVQRLLGVRVTGVFDTVTRDAVKAAQAGAGLASTGVVASRTWSLFDRLSA
ncbi:MAG: Peptidoglycan-binding domain 1 protein [Humibacillus sp.]|nr:Peptidoglycan-binding domain 1 protein [Humibacillus sp.]